MIKQHVVNEVDYQYINKLVHENFGMGHNPKPYNRQAYNFICTEECGNDCCISFPEVSTGEGDDDEYYADEIAEFLKDGTPGDLPNSVIMGLLCQRGLIPPGDYLVNVCW